MRIRLTVLFLLVSSSAFSQVFKFRISLGVQPVGTATIQDSVAKNGSLISRIEMSMSLGGDKVVIRTVEEYLPDGTPLRTTEEDISSTEPDKTTVQYGKRSVVVTRTVGKKTTKKEVPLPKGSIKVPSSNWFRKVRPKLGAKATYWVFDDEAYRWDQDYDKYSSQKMIRSRGKMIKAHLIESKDTKVWVDDKGNIIRMTITEGGLRVILERI